MTGRLLTFTVALGMTCAVLGGIASATGSRPGTHTAPAAATEELSHYMTVGGEQRHYIVLRSTGAVAPNVPIILGLSGIGATAAEEINRDGLRPLAAAGHVILVYPDGYDHSWDAGDGCCGQSGAQHVNDVAFLEDLRAQVSRDWSGSWNVVGYSNGGKMALSLECADPDWSAVIVAKAVQVGDCGSPRASNDLFISGSNDPEVPQSAAQGEVARMHQVDGCPAPPHRTVEGDLVEEVWTACVHHTEVVWDDYLNSGHNWPRGGDNTPSGADVTAAIVETNG